MKNTLSKFSYIMSNIFWTSLFFCCYCPLIFVPLAGFSGSSSVLIFVPFVILCASLCTFISFKHNRNRLSVFINALFPFQLFALLSFWDYFTKWAMITVTVTLSLSLLFFMIAVFYKKFPKTRSFFQVLSLRARKSFLGTRLVASLCLSTFVLPIFCNTLTDGNLFSSKDSAKISSIDDSDQWTVENNMETVIQIQPVIWNFLSFSERLEVLEVLKNVTLNSLGVKESIKLTANRMDESVLGYYEYPSRKITINMDHLQNDPVDEVVFSLLHECHHAMTYKAVDYLKSVPDEYIDLPMFEDALIYEKEYSSYVSGLDDFNGYASQYCEMDADLYADRALADYKRKIDEYYENEKES